MLERYFLKYQTVDRIRACWLGTAIERYVEWLEQEGYAQRNVYRRVPLLCHFAQFCEERRVTSLEQAATLVEDFAEHWMKGHARDGMSLPARRRLAEEARNPVNQLLHLQLPDYVGGGRPVRPDPFRNEAPGFFDHLREERGLRESSIKHYRHYLNRFAAFLARHRIASLGELSVATLAAFVVAAAPSAHSPRRSNGCPGRSGDRSPPDGHNGRS